MRTESKNFLMEILQTSSPSGFEMSAQRVVRAYTKNFADNIETDYTGNVISSLKGSEKKPLKIMLSGHSDEIALMTTVVEDDGQIRFSMIGGVDPAVLPGTHVILHTKKKDYPGVVGRKAIHLLPVEERGKVKKENLWADFGFKDKKTAEKIVRVGDPISYRPNYTELENNTIISKACDDKTGIYVVVEALRLVAAKKRQLKSDVFCVTSTMEEIGARGAKTAAGGILPDVGIAVDVTHSTDYPGGDKKISGEIKMGGGAVIARGANISPALFDMLVDIAEKKKIPYQIEAEPRGTGTDANPIQVTGGGVATALISIPLRYMHTPSEVINLKDLESCAKLLAELILALNSKTNLIPM